MPFQHVLELSAISKVFPTPTGPLTVVENVSLKLKEGEFVSIMGPSGCGKSTVLNMVAGLSEPVVVQRIHADFHLGQTLHTHRGWKIIDFEGEPAKTMAERRAPDAVWRDIAGMLRSFDYAAASVPGPRSQAWAAQCRTAFLRGYTGAELSAADASMLRAYEADKAIYEVVYEIRNRPDWVGIPLHAVATLAADSNDFEDSDPPPTLVGSNQVPSGEPASQPKSAGEPASQPKSNGEPASPTREQG